MALALLYRLDIKQTTGRRDGGKSIQEEGSVTVNFYPCRNRMSREIDECTSLQNLERLLSFCSSCIYRIFEQAKGMDTVPMAYSREAHYMNNTNQNLDFNIERAGMRELAESGKLLNVC